MTFLISGKLAENYVAFLLKLSMHKILSRNFNSKHGEIDIIAKKNNILVFVEVKKRLSEDYFNVYSGQQKRIMNAACFYVQKYNLYSFDMRFDVCFVKNNFAINYIKNAFGE